MHSFRFSGIIVPMVTVFQENGEIDWEGNGRLLDYLADSGVHGILILGSIGEFTHLTEQERKAFAAFAAERLQGRVPLLVGTGSPNPREVVDLSRHAFASGANGVVVVCPYYWKLTEEELYAHFAQVAEAVDGPILLYTYPKLTGQDLPPATVFRLAKTYPHIVGIKATVGCLSAIRALLDATREIGPTGFAVFAAFEELLLPALALGAAGGVVGTANFAPRRAVALYEAVCRGEWAEAVAHHRVLTNLMPIYEVQTPPVAALKEAVCRAAVPISTATRIPGLRVDDAVRTRVAQLLSVL